MSSEMTSPTKVGILSIGDMGEGIAKLLVAKGFRVVTNCKGRSEDTVQRAQRAQVEIASSDIELVQQCAVILSVIPPRDAADTAQRIIDALAGSSRSEPLFFADMNAIAPSTCRKIADMFERSKVHARFLDGCILGAPPYLKAEPAAGTNVSTAPEVEGDWYLPGLPMSGPHKLSDCAVIGQKLYDTLQINHISEDIGAASGLKMCFASFSKGHTAIAIQSFTTAHRLGVLEHLKKEMSQRMPEHLRMGERGAVIMAPKAYRWVREMEEISTTHAEDGGFEPYLFQGAAGIYKTVAEDTVLGQEKIGKRQRGTSTEDVAAAMAEGLARKKKKTD